MTKENVTSHGMEKIRILFDESINELPMAISDSLMVLTISINFLIKYDASSETYKALFNNISKANNLLNNAINDLQQIFEEEGWLDSSNAEKS